MAKPKSLGPCPACKESPLMCSLEFMTVRKRTCGCDYAKISVILKCSNHLCGYRDRTAAETVDRETMQELEALAWNLHGDNLASYGKWQVSKGRGKGTFRRITLLSQSTFTEAKP